ncbi:sulfite exporter TauE/SafE family protein [Sphaerisporangium sp. TRM90804]|uniref:sulfite exporter TauE/SafE family protein n=1 Tax=Sphaerisporangium sp. TRM90804 TaxID=3031113 RepID=UPI002448D307|nr:sulfite exporter TauE/SafE family protein [Sphaerisporangium sp. TRM90804]MDH2427942.1 sulfite exporter TauE/SafE family protein [Sphaerisporangium sp. TRM90804]
MLGEKARRVLGMGVTPAALFAAGVAGGLVAGSASCAAVQGGLLIGLARPRGAAAEACCEPSPGRAGAAAVAWFIAARMAAHTLVGALLGLLGGVVRIPPTARAVLLVGAGAAVAVYAVRLLLAARRGDTDEAGCGDGRPRWASLRGGRGASRVSLRGGQGPRWARPGLLGAATVLVPCGVTLSTEIVAVSSGSALGGAAVMAGFVTGTTPAFALLGLLVHRAATTRFRTAAAALALVAGALTVVAGVRLGGWLPEDGGSARADGTQVVTVWVTDQGYRPGVVAVEAGRPADIVFRTSGNQGCTRSLTIQGMDVALPASGTRIVRLPAQKPGKVRYVCGMGMYVGFVIVNEAAEPAAPPVVAGQPRSA